MCKNANMLRYIYLAVLALSAAVCAFFIYYGQTWLASIGDPKTASQGFEYHHSLGGIVLWIAAGVLLLIANIILLTGRSAWAMWTTFGFFAVFTLIRYFWTGPAGFAFHKSFDPTAATYDFSVFLGVFLIVGAAIVVFSDQFLIVRLLKRIYGDEKDEAGAEVEAKNDPDEE